MNKTNFIKWYVSHGLLNLLITWKSIVLFMPKFFSVGLLLRTLLSPWHRDVSPKSWRGFNPIKSTQKFLWNIFSRVVGSIWRLIVICFAEVVWVLSAVIGGIIFIVYIITPVLFLAGIVSLFTPYWIVGAFLVFITLLSIGLAYHTYRLEGHMPYEKMDIMELHKQKWFYRVYERIGISKEDIPNSVLHDFDSFKSLLTKNDITIHEFEQIIAWEIDKQKQREENKKILSLRKFLKKQPIGLNWHFGYTTHLDRYAYDIARGETGSDNMQFFGFGQEMQMAEVVLSRPHENSIILTGEAGIGKHMIVQELARRIHDGYFSGNFMQHMRVLQCDFESIMAHARSRGLDPETIIYNLFYEAAHAGNVIMVVDNFDQYMIKENRKFSFAAIIDQFASMESFRMIGISTGDNFHEYIETNKMLMQHFDVISVPEMDEETAMKVLFMRFYGKKHTPFTFQALRRVLQDSGRYTNNAPLPKRAIDLATEVLVAWQNYGTGFITAQTVDEFIRNKTGVPVGEVSQEESKQLLSLEEEFHKRIVAQDYAVSMVAAAVRRMRSGIAEVNKPAGSFLFLGPTGVGKTEMAKILAEQYFGSPDKMIRLDMSEFQGDSALDRLIGSKELNQQGILAKTAREHPYALLLLDEIEKANPKILDIFLQVLDEGFLHDAFGRKVNFNTMIIIATSNAAAVTIKKMIENGIKDDAMKKKVIDNIIDSGAFRPEILNRFSDVVIFHPLGRDHIPRVTQMILEKFEKRMEEEHNINIIFDDDVVKRIIDNGYDPVFGARSIIRYVDEVVADSLAKKLITGNVHHGETVRFSIEDLSK